MTDYNYIDFCSGIGGFGLGAYMAGMRFKNHFASEIDKYCIELYQKRFPDSIQLGDIKKINFQELKEKYGNKWITTGGIPCQPHSIAGKRKASEDERDLWPEYFRMLGILRPEFAFIENVPGLFTSDRGRFFNGILSDISSIRYDCEWTIISASDMGAPHKRERIWIVAYSASRENDGRKSGNMADQEKRGERIDATANACGEDVAFSAEPGLPKPQASEQQKQLLHAKRGSSEIPHSFIQHDDDSGHGAGKICGKQSCETEIQGQFSDSAIPRLEGEESESEFRQRQQRLFAECDWWSVEPPICRMANELSERLDEDGSQSETIINGGIKDLWQACTEIGYVPTSLSEIPKIWESLDDEEKDWIALRINKRDAWHSEWPNVGRLATGIKNRVDRLKGLGNSIVPQIAQLLFNQIKPLL